MNKPRAYKGGRLRYLCWLFSTILCDVVSVTQEQEDRECEGISSVFLNKSVKICYPMSASWFFVFVVVFQTWEKAIELCKELAEQYQSYLYDYMKLANILVCIYIVPGPVVRRPIGANL